MLISKWAVNKPLGSIQDTPRNWINLKLLPAQKLALSQSVDCTVCHKRPLSVPRLVQAFDFSSWGKLRETMWLISSHVKVMAFQAHLLKAATDRMIIPASNNCLKLARLPDVDLENVLFIFKIYTFIYNIKCEKK